MKTRRAVGAFLAVVVVCAAVFRAPVAAAQAVYEGLSVAQWAELLLTEASLDRRVEAAHTLGEFPASLAAETLPPLLHTLVEPFRPLQLTDRYAFDDVTRFGQAFPVDPEARLKLAVVEALERMGPAAREALPHLIGLFDLSRIDAQLATVDHLLPKIAEGSLTALERTEVTNLTSIGLADLVVGVAAAQAAGRVGTRDVPTLVDALASDVPNRRSGAARALGEIGAAAREVVPLLERMAADDAQPDGLRRTAADTALKIRAASR